MVTARHVIADGITVYDPGMAGDTYTVERSIMIDCAPDAIYDRIANFRHWPEWSPWEGIDPQMKRVYAGAESGVGATYSWSGNRKAGQGRMEIIEAQRPTVVRSTLVFEKPFKARNDTAFTIQPDGSRSRVTWSMTGRKTLVTKAMSLFKSMDSLLGPDFEKGLARLKAAAEKVA